MRRKLEATEMWFLRRMIRIPWTENTTNETVLIDANAKRTPVNDFRKRKVTFFGHVMRRRGLEHLAATGNINRLRSRGQQRIKMLDDLRIWLGIANNNTVTRATEDKEKWRAMIANHIPARHLKMMIFDFPMVQSVL